MDFHQVIRIMIFFVDDSLIIKYMSEMNDEQSKETQKFASSKTYLFNTCIDSVYVCYRMKQLHLTSI
jgi:hypothetical protein